MPSAGHDGEYNKCCKLLLLASRAMGEAGIESVGYMLSSCPFVQTSLSLMMTVQANGWQSWFLLVLT